MSIDYNLSSPEIPPSHEVEFRAISPQDTEIFQQWLSVRQDFMEERGWHFGDDSDRYDVDPRTFHIIKERVQTDEIMVGMRLTPCEEIEDSLSWSMLAPHLQEQVRGNLPQLNEHENKWDLTRLVSGHLSHNEVTDSLLEVFGSGVALTDRNIHASPRWFFATTPAFIGLFKRQGVEFVELVRGKNDPKDRSDVVFCYADAADIVDELRRNGSPSYEATQRGMYAV